MCQTYTRHVNSKIPSNYIETKVVSNLDECESNCTDNTCSGFEFNSVTKSCGTKQYGSYTGFTVSLGTDFYNKITVPGMGSILV